MKKNSLLVLVSVLSIIFMTIHLAGDIIFGMEKGGALNLVALPVLAIWLYGTLVLPGKRWGYIIILLGGLLGLLMPVLHMKGNGINPELLKSNGAFIFVWTLIAIGVTSLFAVILATIQLLKLQRSTGTNVQ